MELKIPKRLQQEKSAAKPSRKPRSSGSSKGAKYVLFLGDEGAILIYLRQNAVLSRQFVPDASESNLNELRQTLLKDIHAPVMLAIDSMDQSFMQQTLPPVSVVSVNKLIKRRLERDFAGNDIKGAVLLGREKSGRRDWNFLMVALEKSPQLSVWLDFIQALPHRLQGIYLASVEAELLVKKLDQKFQKKSKDEAEWKFFVSHNKVGGFRQVVMRNGRIIFTRMAQPVGESNAEVIAGGIEQEMLSTIEYMKRLSFSPQNKLDIYIITSTAIKSVIDRNKFNASALHILTPYEAADLLGIEGAAQPNDQFGDVLMASSIGLNKKPVLRLVAPQMQRIDQCYQIMATNRMIAGLTLLAMVGYAGYVSYGIFSLANENDELSMQHQTMQQNLATLREHIKSAKLDVEKASDLIDLYTQIGKEKASPLPLLAKFEALSRTPVWIKDFNWSYPAEDKGKAPAAAAAPPVAAGKNLISMQLTLEFPQEATDPKVYRVLTKKVLADFREQFSGYDVDYVKLGEEPKDTEKLEIRSGVTQESSIKSLEAQLLIKGPLLPPDKSSNGKTVQNPPAIPAPSLIKP